MEGSFIPSVGRSRTEVFAFGRTGGASSGDQVVLVQVPGLFSDLWSLCRMVHDLGLSPAVIGARGRKGEGPAENGTRPAYVWPVQSPH